MKYYAVFIFSIIFLVGCASKEEVQVQAPIEEEVVHQPYSLKLMKELNLTDEFIYKLQFYTSHDIVLYRSVPKKNSKIVDGKLIIEKGEDRSEIVIKAGTPCVVEDRIGNRLLVSFEGNYELIFSNPRNKSNQDGLFLFSATKWKNDIGIITMNGLSYQAIGTSAKSYLMIDKEELDDSSNQSLVLEGKMVERPIEVNEVNETVN